MTSVCALVTVVQLISHYNTAYKLLIILRILCGFWQQARWLVITGSAAEASAVQDITQWRLHTITRYTGQRAVSAIISLTPLDIDSPSAHLLRGESDSNSRNVKLTIMKSSNAFSVIRLGRFTTWPGTLPCTAVQSGWSLRHGRVTWPREIICLPSLLYSSMWQYSNTNCTESIDITDLDRSRSSILRWQSTYWPAITTPTVTSSWRHSCTSIIPQWRHNLSSRGRIPWGGATVGQLRTGTLMGHPPAAEKRRARKLGCVVGASDTIMFINGYHRNQPIDRRCTRKPSVVRG